MSSSQPDSTDASSTASRDRLLSLYKSMKDEIDNLVDNDANSQRALVEVNSDLSISRRAYASLEAEYTNMKAEKERLVKERDDLMNQIKPNRIVVLVDGDGAIFDLDLISEGLSGGHKAASKLSETIKKQYSNRTHLELSVHVFLNKHGLATKFARIKRMDARNKLNEFVVGFNQASERFVMADVGYAKEGADAKIKAFLEAEIRLPQTETVIFAGCHDNGYVTALRSHITSGFEHKLTLLQSYDDFAVGIKDLNLPVLAIPGLFIRDNLDLLETPAATYTDLPPPSTPSPVPQPLPTQTPRHRERSRKRADSRAESVASGYEQPSDQTGPSNGENGGGLQNPTGMQINPALPLHAQKPQICVNHYLVPGGCKFQRGCKFSHFYELTPSQLDQLRAKSKGYPCTNILKGQTCHFGDSCIYGHKCQYSVRCKYKKAGKCHFKAESMHII
ncbi:hypothetical protein DFP72DRAFT_903430 [Ephemerocybe angulata]|uniref:C3H1-type domain-containing protein n=1 Tax=Ephemerocybe angulata TaxID=980116 RepID=A0A8H6M2H7_9AGAR|nr:hypothetical protein DFP72DRAFT_903430 [Tulosesus angulatus]